MNTMTAQDRLALMIRAMIGDERDGQHEPTNCEPDDVVDDWREYDRVDYLALADYYDQIAIEQAGGI